MKIQINILKSRDITSEGKIREKKKKRELIGPLTKKHKRIKVRKLIKNLSGLTNDRSCIM